MGQETTSESQMLDCIYDDELLGFEKDPTNFSVKMHAQDPLKEVDLGDGGIKRPTYINTKVKYHLKKDVIELLKKFKDC